MPKMVVVFPVPGGPCTRVMPPTFAESRMACCCERLYLLVMCFIKPSGMSNLFVTSSAPTGGAALACAVNASTSTPPSSFMPGIAGAACMSTVRGPVASSLLMMNFRSGMVGSDMRASYSRICVAKEVTLVRNQLLFSAISLARSFSLEASFPSRFSFTLIVTLLAKLCSTIANICKGVSCNGSSFCESSIMSLMERRTFWLRLVSRCTVKLMKPGSSIAGLKLWNSTSSVGEGFSEPGILTMSSCLQRFSCAFNSW
mmetsp:Transcript_64559/g.154230  ORF Transcript_64559/g.154230 Transcript_64559/m.154230 type:complete len:257 (+) Transcript_64559:2060-2830(+)